MIADLAEAVGRLKVSDRGSLLSLAGRDGIIGLLRARAPANSGAATNGLDRILRDLFLPLPTKPAASAMGEHSDP